MQRAGTVVVLVTLGALLAFRSAPVQSMAARTDPVVIELGDFRATRADIDRRFRIAAGLLARRQGMTLDDQDPAALARLPGFSTAGRVWSAVGEIPSRGLPDGPEAGDGVDFTLLPGTLAVAEGGLERVDDPLAASPLDSETVEDDDDPSFLWM